MEEQKLKGLWLQVTGIFQIKDEMKEGCGQKRERKEIFVCRYFAWCQAWWHVSLILALQRQIYAWDSEFPASQVYIVSGALSQKTVCMGWGCNSVSRVSA